MNPATACSKPLSLALDKRLTIASKVWGLSQLCRPGCNSLFCTDQLPDGSAHWAVGDAVPVGPSPSRLVPRSSNPEGPELLTVLLRR